MLLYLGDKRQNTWWPIHILIMGNQPAFVYPYTSSSWATSQPSSTHTHSHHGQPASLRLPIHILIMGNQPAFVYPYTSSSWAISPPSSTHTQSSSWATSEPSSTHTHPHHGQPASLRLPTYPLQLQTDALDQG